MKLDTLVLAMVIVFVVLWLGAAVTGLMAAVPYGWLGLIPIALVGGVVVTVVYQRLTNKEDDYYEKNVEK